MHHEKENKKYYVNIEDKTIHLEGCEELGKATENTRELVGEFLSCNDAVEEARNRGMEVKSCAKCLGECTVI